jgi:hypothetical protein
MLDGRSVIEVPWSMRTGGAVFAGRMWLVRFGRDGGKGRTMHQAVRSPHTRTWFVPTGWGPAHEYPTLRDVRRFLFDGNGRLTGGHPEVTDAVQAPMSVVNILMLASIRTVPGTGDYWSD